MPYLISRHEYLYMLQVETPTFFCLFYKKTSWLVHPATQVGRPGPSLSVGLDLWIRCLMVVVRGTHQKRGNSTTCSTHSRLMLNLTSRVLDCVLRHRTCNYERIIYIWRIYTNIHILLSTFKIVFNWAWRIPPSSLPRSKIRTRQTRPLIPN